MEAKNPPKANDERGPPEPCPKCKGTGLSDNRRYHCPACLGSGKREKRQTGWQ